uniref:Uncharacterized protein n=1 Tax=Rhodnius prolixus TaxID=13249 RepID=T1HQZ9_RHOPR
MPPIELFQFHIYSHSLLHFENFNENQEVNAPLAIASRSSSGSNMAIASTSSSGANISFEEISPIPRFQKPKQTRRKKQTAEVLNDGAETEGIEKKG